MRNRLTIGVAMLTGIGIGALTVQGLHAQATKLKAYSVAEIEVLDRAGQGPYLTKVRQAIKAAHGRALGTAAGRVVHIEGAEAPKNVGIVEWNSVDEAVSFYKSKAWTDIASERDKMQKTIRRYVVEVEK